MRKELTPAQKRSVQRDKRILALLNEGSFSVTETGVILSHNFGRRGLTKEIAQCLDQDGYLLVSMRPIGIVRAHRVIALALLDKPRGYWEVNHKNGIKSDNRIENLEWVTSSQNRRHAFDTGLQKPTSGSHRGLAKITAEQASEIHHLLAEGNLTLEQIAQKYAIGAGGVNSIKRGRAWSNLSSATIKRKRSNTKAGERNVRAKLTRIQVAEIREKLKSGKTVAAIAREFGLGWQTVNHIKQGNTWSDK